MSVMLCEGALSEGIAASSRAPPRCAESVSVRVRVYVDVWSIGFRWVLAKAQKNAVQSSALQRQPSQ